MKFPQLTSKPPNPVSVEGSLVATPEGTFFKEACVGTCQAFLPCTAIDVNGRHVTKSPCSSLKNAPPSLPHLPPQHFWLWQCRWYRKGLVQRNCCHSSVNNTGLNSINTNESFIQWGAEHMQTDQGEGLYLDGLRLAKTKAGPRGFREGAVQTARAPTTPIHSPWFSTSVCTPSLAWPSRFPNGPCPGRSFLPSSYP